jgi:hypothetical protein
VEAEDHVLGENELSLSRVHFGHLKARAESTYIINNTQLASDLEITNMQQDILELHLPLINMLTQYTKTAEM